MQSQVVKVLGWDSHPGESPICLTPGSQRPGLPDASQRGFPSINNNQRPPFSPLCDSVPYSTKHIIPIYPFPAFAAVSEVTDLLTPY